MGQVVLVTGALGGLGLALANRFGAAGSTLLLSDLPATADVERWPGATYLSADLMQPGGGRALIAAANEVAGRVDVLINNAGLQKVSPLVDFADADWDRVVDLNLRAAFETMRGALPGMIERGFGRIINIASAHGLVASPYKAAYVAAKHGLLGLTKTAALEVAEAGVTVNAICPGYVRTPLVEAQIADQMRAHGLDRDAVIRDVILASQPTRRFVEAEEVAGLAAYLAGDLARSITGTAVSIDGGWTAR